jgi:glucosamine 6-phosphate synthetase-like amidotransferase/phosphosugar isomerase protein
MWQAIKDTLTRNLLINQERGEAATGLAVIQADGQMLIHKMPLPAAEFVATPEYEALLANLGPETTLLLGHTRHPTKGDPACNDNNHPLQAGPICGIHNGHVNNHDALFANCGCPRQGQVDSEVIFRLLETLSPLQLNGTYLTAVRSQLQQLQGEFTFLACDRRAPEQLLVLKHHKPLSLHFHPVWNVLIFSSRYIFLRKTFGRSLLAERLPSNQLLLFDARALPRLGHRPVAASPL